MMKRKKILAGFVLLSAMVLLVTGCGGKSSVQNNPPTSQATATLAPGETPATSTPAPPLPEVSVVNLEDAPYVPHGGSLPDGLYLGDGHRGGKNVQGRYGAGAAAGAAFLDFGDAARALDLGRGG